MGPGIKGVGQGSEGWDLRSQPWDQGSETMGSGAVIFLGIRLYHIKDQGPKLVTLLESRIRHLHTKMGSALKSIAH